MPVLVLSVLVWLSGLLTVDDVTKIDAFVPAVLALLTSALTWVGGGARLVVLGAGKVQEMWLSSNWTLGLAAVKTSRRAFGSVCNK